WRLGGNRKVDPVLKGTDNKLEEQHKHKRKTQAQKNNRKKNKRNKKEKQIHHYITLSYKLKIEKK
ncbi:hypothetical protein ACSMCR_24205, partial [Salmonella enterica]|uniref:hypothetical protein n=1 Tax=Salmonella enterica TaxID=28901 RepID=UPI003F1AA0CB